MNVAKREMIQICPECGKQFSCDIAAGKETCWCFSHPKVHPDRTSMKCLCPDCLDTMLLNQQNEFPTP